MQVDDKTWTDTHRHAHTRSITYQVPVEKSSQDATSLRPRNGTSPRGAACGGGIMQRCERRADICCRRRAARESVCVRVCVFGALKTKGPF